MAFVMPQFWAFDKQPLKVNKNKVLY